MKTLLLLLVALTLTSCASRGPASDEATPEQQRDVSRGMNADYFNPR